MTFAAAELVTDSLRSIAHVLSISHIKELPYRNWLIAESNVSRFSAFKNYMAMGMLIPVTVFPPMQVATFILCELNRYELNPRPRMSHKRKK